jgi:spermidine synthase
MQREVIKANVVVFIASFCTLVIELVAGRIMAPYVGVSLYTWTSIIGVVLAGISVGAYLGGLIADRYPYYRTLGWLLLLSGLGAFSISPLTQLLGGTSFQTTLMVRILIITTLIFFVPSCLLGMISPVVVKLTLNNLNRTGNIIGKIYAFSTLGSILGTFATGFFLISWMGTRHILLTMGVILMLSGLIFGGFFVRKKALPLSLALFIPLTGVWHGYAFKPPLDEETYFFKESNYYTIKLKRNITQGGGACLESLILDHFVQSYTDLNDPLYLEYRYLRIYEEFVRWQADKKKSFKCLFIGGGGYTFPRFLEAEYPGAEIDVVEIDPEVTRVAKRYLGISENSRIRSFNEDARWFVMNCTEEKTYDLIFEDVFNDLSLPYHLTTREFALQLERLLKPDGLLLTNLIDSFTKGIFLPSYIQTLEGVFGGGNVHLVTHYANYDMGISTYIVMAGAGKLDIGEFLETVIRHGDKELSSSIISPDRLQQYLKERRPVTLTDDFAPVDNMLAPIFEERYGYQG